MMVTERLTLTAVTVEDAEAMVDVLGDDHLHHFTGGHPETVEQLRARYRRYLAGPDAPAMTWHNWIVRTLDDNAAVGTMQATIAPTPDGRLVAEVAWVIGVAWQGQGLATEAGRAVIVWLAGNGVDEVIAHIHPDHHASVLVARRIGLRPTAEHHHGETTWWRALKPPGPPSPHDRSPGGPG